MNYLKKTHDLSLPKWGPYTKKYMGISHIADAKNGVRFDLSIMPGFYKKEIAEPSVLRESGYHPWEASADLNYYCHRHELEWKDKVYCDISFSAITDNERLIRCECVNNTETLQYVVINYAAYINYPYIHGSSQICKIQLPEGAVYVDALDYENIEFAIMHPQDNLVFDAYLRGEVRDSSFVNGSGLGGIFNKEAGNRATYSLNIKKSLEDGIFVIRYRLEKDKLAVLKFSGVINKCLEFTGTGEFENKTIPIGWLAEGKHELEVISMGECEINIDSFLLVPAERYNEVNYNVEQHNVYPEISIGPSENSLILKYGEVESYYGLKWDYDNYQIREFLCDELENVKGTFEYDQTNKKIIGKGNGHTTNISLQPISIKPGENKLIYGMVCSGSKAEVESMLMKFSSHHKRHEELYQIRRADITDLSCNDQGIKYILSQRLMSATTLTNVVYPIYMKRSYIKHSTPGRCWDSLYTWDSGFIGLGLAELDIDRAIDNLNAYMTEPGDQHAAFIHHGSPVPVQHYLFLELWNLTQSRELLEYFYPRLRQYYLFLAGKLGSSTTGQLKSNILKTWDYFYNSGGWDDYPPQKYVHDNKLEDNIAPAVNTAHSIRTAKILRMAALELGFKKDAEEYSEDIQIFGNALQKLSWDDEAGYFGYVVHDDKGSPIGILRHECGVNFNMGIDGVYPLVAGICSNSQMERLLAHLFSNNELWSEIGLSTVDQSAPYFESDGYWNGSVWMPHQWFIWKTLLDLGKPEDAYRIAKTGLDIWKKETDRTYNCFEHFVIKSQQGDGWHHFSGLSTPVLSWFSSYHRPGRLTCGFDIWIKDYRFSNENSMLTACFKLFGNADIHPSIIAVMNPKYKYLVEWKENNLHYNEIYNGVLLIKLPDYEGEGLLTIRTYDRKKDSCQ